MTQTLPAAASTLNEDALSFRDAMRHLAGIVSVVSIGQGATRTGMTATSVSSYSVDPPTVILCVNRQSSAWAALKEHGHFAVNVLAEDQRHIGDNFSGSGGRVGVQRYSDGKWTTLVTGAPILDGALVNIDCDLEEAIERHTHSIIIGRVRAVRSESRARPLLFWHGRYAPIAAPFSPIY